MGMYVVNARRSWKLHTYLYILKSSFSSRLQAYLICTYLFFTLSGLHLFYRRLVRIPRTSRKPCSE